VPDKKHFESVSGVAYRLIANLLFLSKILEKVVVNQFCEFPQNDGLFENFQSGF